MNLSRWPALVVLVGVCWHSRGRPRASGRIQDPHIGYIYPAGGQAGTTCEVTVGGEYLRGATGAYISGGGVRVRWSSTSSHLSQENGRLQANSATRRRNSRGAIRQKPL